MSVEFRNSINTLPAVKTDYISLPMLHVTRKLDRTVVNFIPEQYTNERPLMRLTYGPERIAVARTFDELRTSEHYAQTVQKYVNDVYGGVFPRDEHEVARLLRQIEMLYISPTVSIDFEHAKAYFHSSNDTDHFRVSPIRIDTAIEVDGSGFVYDEQDHLGTIVVTRPDDSMTTFQFPLYPGSHIPVSQFSVYSCSPPAIK